MLAVAAASARVPLGGHAASRSSLTCSFPVSFAGRGGASSHSVVLADTLLAERTFLHAGRVWPCLTANSHFDPPPHSLPTICSCRVDVQEKTERMRSIIEHYIKGDEHALDRWPGGSEPGTR